MNVIEQLKTTAALVESSPHTADMCAQAVTLIQNLEKEIERLKGIRSLDNDFITKFVESSNERDREKVTVTCPACSGFKTQFSQKLGMRDLCPACDGRGWIDNPQRQ